MERSDPMIHSFVVKIWIEAASQPPWHGYITHVSDGKRCYLRTLDDIRVFIQGYMRNGGVEAGNGDMGAGL
jgi:hypothetical protein